MISRIVGADMNMPHVLSKYDAFELSFKKLYGAANLHAKFIHVRSAEPANGTVGESFLCVPLYWTF